MHLSSVRDGTRPLADLRLLGDTTAAYRLELPLRAVAERELLGQSGHIELSYSAAGLRHRADVLSRLRN